MAVVAVMILKGGNPNRGCLLYKRPRPWSLQGLENSEFGVYLVKGVLMYSCA